MQRHKNATQFRAHSFPHFEELTIIWGKDHATGNDTQATYKNQK